MEFYQKWVVVIFLVFGSLLLVGKTMLPKFKTIKYKKIRSENPWERWENAFEDPSEYDDSVLGEILVPLHTKLNKILNPKDCRKQSFVVLDYGASVGFGAQLTEIVTAFASSLLADRIMLFNDTNGFLWAEGCPEGSLFSCFFRNITKCSLDQVRHLIKNGNLKVIDFDPESAPFGKAPNIPSADPKEPSVVSFEFGRNFFRKIRDESHLTKVVSHLIGDALPLHIKNDLHSAISAQRATQIGLSTYMTRLNRKTSSYVRENVEKILSSYKIGPKDFYKVVGIPVRKSDKCYNNSITEYGEMECVSLEQTVQYAGRVAFANPSITHALLTSEDQGVLNATKKNPERKTFVPLKIITNYLDLPPGSGWKKMRTDKTKYDLMKAMLVTLHLQSFAGFHVLTPRSSFHTIIVAYANSFPGKSRYYFFPIGTENDVKESGLWTLMR